MQIIANNALKEHRASKIIQSERGQKQRKAKNTTIFSRKKKLREVKKKIAYTMSANITNTCSAPSLRQ